MSGLIKLIIVVAILLFYLDYRERNYNKNNEGFTNIDDGFNTSFNNNSSVNFNKKLNFSNFSTNGNSPYINCPLNGIDFNCTNYPYNLSNQNMSVCTNSINQNTNNVNLKVLAKSAGRPRQCKDLY